MRSTCATRTARETRRTARETRRTARETRGRLVERLQKLIAHSGIASRRTAEDLIREGRVTVDGAPAHLGQKIDPELAWVEVDGVALPVKPDLVYYLLYKPVGVISTTEDTHDRPTVTSLVPAGTRLYPVGRLDADSEGLLLLTNDGALTERITHPRYGVAKTYLAEVAGSVGAKAIARLVGGVELDDGPARAAAARVVDGGRSRSLVEVTMTEGRKREIRRMFDVVGHPVRRLVREAIGPIRDRQLKPGEWRELSLTEVRSLYAAATEQ